MIRRPQTRQVGDRRPDPHMVDEPPGGRRGAAQPPTMSAVRLPYLALGGLSLGLGVIGAFVPLMPTTVFLIVATWAFARSSPRLYRAILDHPRWGPSLHHWHTHRCLSRRTKTIAIASIAVSFALSAYVMRERLGLVIAVGLLLLAVVAYLMTRPRCVMDGRHPTDPGTAASRAPHSPVGRRSDTPRPARLARRASRAAADTAAAAAVRHQERHDQGFLRLIRSGADGRVRRPTTHSTVGATTLMEWMTMLTIASEDDGIVTVRASGQLTRADHGQFVAQMEQIMRTQGPVRMLIELVDFKGGALAALWEDLKFDSQPQDDMGRVAIVGEDRMQKWVIRPSAPFFRADMRYFPRGEMARARDWSIGGSPPVPSHVPGVPSGP